MREGFLTIIITMMTTTTTTCVWITLRIISFVNLRNLRRFFVSCMGRRTQKGREASDCFLLLSFFALCLDELISRLKEREK